MSNTEGHTSAHFFKVILPSTLEDKKMGIPVKFVRKFKNELSAVAILRVPNGCIWRVGLKNDEINIWFHDGWHNFVKYYSICVGYFLIFQYVKNSTFNVLIFDMSACEIDYPSNIDRHEDYKQDAMKNENSVKILDSSSKNKRSVSHLKMKESQSKKCERNDQEDLEKISNGRDDHDFLALLDKKGFIIAGRSFYSTEERKRAIEIARLFKPKNPTFMVFPYIWGYHRVYIPAKFTINYVNESAKFCKLKDSDGREWPVQFCRASNRKNGIYISKGWNRFCKDKNIHEGDICVFELISKNDVVLKVSVFHPIPIE